MWEWLPGKRADKFQTTGLTPVKSDLVDAPYVGRVSHDLGVQGSFTRYEIGLHTQFIGEILDVKVDETALE